MEKSSGILIYRFKNNILQVLLGKCGGPSWDKMNKGAWNIPKGHVEENETTLETAKREFFEETNLDLSKVSDSNYLYLGETSTKSRKHVFIYSVKYNFNPKFNEDSVIIKSNMCEVEWPRKSGNMILIPELSCAKYFNIDEAYFYIFPYQKIFLDRLKSSLGIE